MYATEERYCQIYGLQFHQDTNRDFRPPRNVTSSSAAVGCMATVLSKSDLQAPIAIATATLTAKSHNCVWQFLQQFLDLVELSHFSHSCIPVSHIFFEVCIYIYRNKAVGL